MDYYSQYENIMGGFMAFIGIFLLLILVILIVGIIATWKLFKKAGRNGWESIIPFYSYWILIEIADLNWWWFILIIASNIVNAIELEVLAPIASLVSIFASFNCYYNIAKKFNKSTGTAVCAGLFPFIFVLIFAFSKKEVYNANIPVSKNGVFGSPDESTTDNVVASTNFVDSTNDMSRSNVNQEFSYCSTCGTKLTKDARFCPNCGRQNV